VFGYLLYVAAITIWNVRFPLQVVGVCLSVMLIYTIGARWGTHGLPQRCVVELGKYSLFSYVTQIAALQLLRRGLRGADLTGAELLVPFALALAATILAVQLVVTVRARSAVADSLYRTVFA
jgi:peptidoglycan/LPS O-acetylase OafA/YrhL